MDLQPQPRPGWWSRNWKWVVPVLCVVVVAVVLPFLARTSSSRSWTAP